MRFSTELGRISRLRTDNQRTRGKIVFHGVDVAESVLTSTYSIPVFLYIVPRRWRSPCARIPRHGEPRPHSAQGRPMKSTRGVRIRTARPTSRAKGGVYACGNPFTPKPRSRCRFRNDGSTRVHSSSQLQAENGSGRRRAACLVSRVHSSIPPARPPAFPPWRAQMVARSWAPGPCLPATTFLTSARNGIRRHHRRGLRASIGTTFLFGSLLFFDVAGG